MGFISIFGMFMATQFEPHADGYAFRVNGKGPALPVTRAERDRYVRRAGWSFLFHTAAFLLCVIAAAMLTATWFPAGDEAGGFVLMGGLLILIIFALYRSLRWAMRAPARDFADRTPVAPARSQPRPGPQRPAGGRAPRQPARPAGCLFLIGFALVEMIAGIAVGALGYHLLIGRGQGLAFLGALLGWLGTVVLIEWWARRRVLTRLLDILSEIP